jgi:hypothetical protein
VQHPDQPAVDLEHRQLGAGQVERGHVVDQVGELLAVLAEASEHPVDVAHRGGCPSEQAGVARLGHRVGPERGPRSEAQRGHQ